MKPGTQIKNTPKDQNLRIFQEATDRLRADQLPEFFQKLASVIIANTTAEVFNALIQDALELTEKHHEAK